MVKEYGYEYEASLDSRLWKETAGRTTNEKLLGALCLSSGRDALKAIAREYEPAVAMLPALACDSMILPFEMYGHKIRYYRLNSDYTIDLSDLDPGEGRALFLYMDYFGIPSVTDEELNALRARNSRLVFIEDRTHTLPRKRTSSFRPEYTIASLRKWLLIPDGGLLWGKVSCPLSEDTEFSQTRLKAQNMRYEFLHGGDASLKPEYRKIFSTVSDILDGAKKPAAMSAYAYELAKRTDWKQLRAVRRANAEALISVLSATPLISFIQKQPGMSDLYVPFTVPNRDEVQRRLSAEGIFNTIIWPLTEGQKDYCKTAKFTEENMLAAPCDQRYTVPDMLEIGKEIVRVIEDVNR